MQVQIGRGAANGFLRFTSGLKFGEIERWLDFDEVPQLLDRHRAALQQFLPGERGRLAGQNVTQGSIRE